MKRKDFIELVARAVEHLENGIEGFNCNALKHAMANMEGYDCFSKSVRPNVVKLIKLFTEITYPMRFNESMSKSASYLGFYFNKRMVTVLYPHYWENWKERDLIEYRLLCLGLFEYEVLRTKSYKRLDKIKRVKVSRSQRKKTF